MSKGSKGFTLIELLAAIMILSTIAIITTVSIERGLNKSNQDTSLVQIEMIETAAKAYANDNLGECKNGCVVTIDKLENYLDNYENVKDKYGCVDVTKKRNNFSSKLIIDINDQKCKIKYVDNNIANEPILADGMIPVIYNDNDDVWEVADKNTLWYDYDNQMWANAVTTSVASYRTASPGTPIPMDVINSMWVWIPRFKYKIPSNIGSSTNITSPPQIDVVFETGTQTTGVSEAVYRNGIASDGTNTNYYTHPSFRNVNNIEYDSSTTSRGAWDEEITGYWVGKFETGTSDETCNNNLNEGSCYDTCILCNDVNPVIKPDINSLRVQTVSNQFLTSLKFANGTMNTTTGEVTFSVNSSNIYGLNTKANTTDTHMMKNTEWGAVAILSQSQYGKMGNSNYEGTNKEIYVNNSSKSYTGRSSGTPSISINGKEVYGLYSYNDKPCSYGNPVCSGDEVQYKGTGASTTGTVYGVYDINGGSTEYTMGNWDNYSGSNSTVNSGFSGTSGPTSGSISFPKAKYYDLYQRTSYNDVTKTKSILGDATWEVMKWYSDNIDFVNNSYPWFIRGNGGIFSFNNTHGGGVIAYSFRTTLIP